MANQISDYKCPCCTGPLHFASASGKMECDYCGSSFTPEEIDAMYSKKDAAAAEAMDAPKDEWETVAQEWVEEGMKAYSCPSCGAELILDATTAATACPYCGNTTIVPGQFAGTLKPEYVIPFKLDKGKAEEELKNFYKGKPFLPKAFTAGNHIEEVKGVYVPFWLYDGNAHAEGNYEGQKIESHTKGDTRITITEHYHVERVGDIAFERIPADGSSKMPDDMMDSIEPYDYSEFKEFSSAYLAGFMADKYDVDAEENAERAVSRAKQSAIDAMKADVKDYDQVNTIEENVSVKQGKVTYALMPVWMLSTKWNDQNFLFAMNGQSGKFVGALPIDKKKSTWTFIGIAAGLELLMIILAAIGIWGGDFFWSLFQFVLVPFGGAAAVVGILKSKMSNVAKATTATEYVLDEGMKFTKQTDQFIRRTEEKEYISND